MNKEQFRINLKKSLSDEEYKTIEDIARKHDIGFIFFQGFEYINKAIELLKPLTGGQDE